MDEMVGWINCKMHRCKASFTQGLFACNVTLTRLCSAEIWTMTWERSMPTATRTEPSVEQRLLQMQPNGRLTRRGGWGIAEEGGV